MSFDAIAPHYQWLERVTAGSLLQRCRTEFIQEIKDARNILLLGEGLGRFLSEVLQQNPEAQITCVDASARMLELTCAELQKRALSNRPRPSSSNIPAESRPRTRQTAAQAFVSANSRDFPVSGYVMATGKLLGPADRNVRATTRFVHADVLSEGLPTGPNPFDAVASHFFLDCFRLDQLDRISSMVAECTAPGATWLISDFCVPERGWRRLRASWILWGLYRFFRLTTRLPAIRLTPPDGSLQQAGFRVKDRRHFNHGLLHSDVWVKIDP